EMRLVAWLIILATSGCGRSVAERVSDAIAPTMRYREAAEASQLFAAYLYALDEPSLYEPSLGGSEAAGLQVRLLVVTNQPAWAVTRIEESGNGAMVHFRASDVRPQTYAVPAAAWRAFQDTLAAVDVWAAPWRSLDLILDGWVF